MAWSGASQGQVRLSRVAALIEAARTSVAARRAEAALAVKVRVLVRQVAAIDRDIADVEAAIEAGFADLGHSPHDFPVGGAVSLATILGGR